MAQQQKQAPIETILGYKQSIAGSEAYHYTMSRKFIRVIMGLAIPVFDRVSGAAVILAENYRPGGPPSWIVMGATCGAWPEVENAMAQFRQDLKFNIVVVDSEEHRKIVWNMKGMKWGLGEIPLLVYPAPRYASGEVGRAYTDELIRESRLAGVDDPRIIQTMEIEPQMSRLALDFATTYAREFKAHYTPIKKMERRSRPLGMIGLE